MLLNAEACDCITFSMSDLFSCTWEVQQKPTETHLSSIQIKFIVLPFFFITISVFLGSMITLANEFHRTTDMKQADKN